MFGEDFALYADRSVNFSQVIFYLIASSQCLLFFLDDKKKKVFESRL